MRQDLTRCFIEAAHLLESADSLIIAAGAGMGVDSGLPDFRGPGGFWQVYPALGRAGLRFEEIASPAVFRSDPTLPWRFYAHRLNLYRATVPHAGFQLLKDWLEAMPLGGFVYTSNVDGQFQRAGFAEQQIVECHGSIHHLQCLAHCSEAIWSADDFFPEIDAEACRITSAMPRCPRCGALARPAILMFSDWEWADGRSETQSVRFNAWRREAERPVLIELGAGSTVATVRYFSQRQNCPIIRINPSEWELPSGRGIGIPCGALAGLEGIQACRAA